MSTTLLESRLNKIRQVKADRDREVVEKELARINAIEECYDKINNLSERIVNLITLAQECFVNDVNIENFFTNQIHHRVGFTNSYSPIFRDKEVSAIGIDNGGCCGETHFRISINTNNDTVFVYGIRQDGRCATNKTRYIEVNDYPNLLKDLQKFIAHFDTFETSFLNFIDTL